MGVRFTEKYQIVPAYSPIETTEAKESVFVALKNAQWVTFLLQTGALLNDTDDAILVTVVSATGNTTNANDTAIPFKYRLSSELGTDAWGAITAGTTAGVSLEATTDKQANRAMLIDVDPASIPALDSDALYVYLDLATTTITSGAISVAAFIEPRYPQNANLTSS